MMAEQEDWELGSQLSQLQLPVDTTPPQPSVVAPYESSDQAWARNIQESQPTAQQGTNEHSLEHSTPTVRFPSDYSVVPDMDNSSDRQFPHPTSSTLHDSANTIQQSSGYEYRVLPDRSVLILPGNSTAAPMSNENGAGGPAVGLPRPLDPQERLRDAAMAARQVVYPADQHTLHTRSRRRECVAWARPPQPRTITKNQLDPRALVYVGYVDHHLMCPICYCPFEEPQKLPCDHCFCKRCIVQSLQNQPNGAQSCPSCRSKVPLSSITSAPKIVEHMLSDLKVECPLQEKGCEMEVTRGSAQDHVDRYCPFSEVRCPVRSCKLLVQRKDAAMNRCLHQITSCRDCNISLMELDVELHQSKDCSNRMTCCPDCKKEVKRIELEAHIEDCVEAIFPCQGKTYGCWFVGKRSALALHKVDCTLSRLAPFLEKQNDMLEAHEAALQRLQYKSSVLETSFQTIQETLGPSSNLVNSPTPTTPTTAGGPFDSTAHHLLSLHESLREEVSRVSATVSELDAKATMMVMNESLRLKDELAHTNAAIGGMRHQVHWLVSGRLQNQQRMAMVRTQATSSSSLTGTSAGSSGQAAEAGLILGPGQPVRRMSDSTRQETKL